MDIDNESYYDSNQNQDLIDPLENDNETPYYESDDKQTREYIRALLRENEIITNPNGKHNSTTVNQYVKNPKRKYAGKFNYTTIIGIIILLLLIIYCVKYYTNKNQSTTVDTLMREHPVFTLRRA
jgi:hypothetical protein